MGCNFIADNNSRLKLYPVPKQVKTVTVHIAFWYFLGVSFLQIMSVYTREFSRLMDTATNLSARNGD